MTIDLLIVLIGHLINTDYNDILDHPRSTFSVKQIYQGLYDHLRQCHNIATTGHTLMIWVLRPQCLTAHLSAFTIRLWQLSSNGVAFLFWRSLTSLKWQGKARGLCVNLGQYQFDICFPWRSITVIFCFPLRLCDSADRLCSGRWEVMNVAQTQAGGKWWMATITPDHQWRLHKAATQRKWLSKEFCSIGGSFMMFYMDLFFPTI